MTSSKKSKKSMSKKRKSIKSKLKKRKSIKSKKIHFNEMVSKNYQMCCVCEESITDYSVLRPLSCIRKYSERSHTLCGTCWFIGKDRRIPFAEEGVNHACPGCEKKLPVYPKSNVKVNGPIFDLTSE